MTTRGLPILPGIPAAALAVAILGVTGCGREPAEAYRLDLTPWQEIDPQMITYRQARVEKIPLERPLAIAAPPAAGGLVAVGRDEAILLDDEWRTTARVALDFRPVAVAATDDGRVFIAGERRVVVWRPPTETLHDWGRLPEETRICAIAANENRVWLADPAASLIRVFDEAGAPLHTIGAPDGDGRRHFILPSRFFALAAADDGTLWAVNPGRHRLENYRPDGSFIGEWGATGVDVASFPGCCNPVRVAVFPDGRFVTVDKGLTRVKVYDQQGRFTGVVAGPETLRDAGENLTVAILAGRRVVVLDPAVALLRVFESR